MSQTNTLATCPFCGAGTTSIRENGRIWQGMKYGEPSSVSVLHHCDGPIGQPHRAIERVGKDTASAIEAWNCRTPAPAAGEAQSVAAPAGMEPVAYRRPDQHGGFEYEDGITSFAHDPTAESLYTAAQVQAMGRALPGWQAEQIADYVADNWPMRKYDMAEIEQRLRILPEAPSRPTLAPLTDEQIEQLTEEHGSDIDGFARAIEAAHGIK